MGLEFQLGEKSQELPQVVGKKKERKERKEEERRGRRRGGRKGRWVGGDGAGSTGVQFRLWWF